jgi:hypothetical protein
MPAPHLGDRLGDFGGGVIVFLIFLIAGLLFLICSLFFAPV